MSNALASTMTGTMTRAMTGPLTGPLTGAGTETVNPAGVRPALKRFGLRAADLALYFLTPEDSSRPMPLRRPRSHKAAKALFWLAASITMGIILARLG